MSMRIRDSSPIAVPAALDLAPLAPPTKIEVEGLATVPTTAALAPRPVADRQHAIKMPGRSVNERAHDKLAAQIDTLLGRALHEVPYGIDAEALASWMNAQSPTEAASAPLLALANAAEHADAHALVWLDEIKKQIESALVRAAGHASTHPPLRQALLSLRPLCHSEPMSAEERIGVNAAFIALESGVPRLTPHLVQLQRLVPEQVARVNAFVDGALTGQGSTAGELVNGVLPGLSQAQALHALPHALRHAASGNGLVYLELGVAAGAIVPGLAFIRHGSVASRETLRAATELGPIAESGLKHATAVMSADGAALARKELKVLNVARTELLARIARLEHPTMKLGERFDALLRVLTNHLKPVDLIGALRDEVGVPVRAAGSGHVFDHSKEVDDALQSISRSIDLVMEHPDSTHFKLVLEGLTEFKNRVSRFMEIR